MPASVTRLMGELVRRSHVTYLELRPLGRADVAAMVVSAWGSGTAVEVVERIMERSHGLPLYVDAILASPDFRANRYDTRTIPGWS